MIPTVILNSSLSRTYQMLNSCILQDLFFFSQLFFLAPISHCLHSSYSFTIANSKSPSFLFQKFFSHSYIHFQLKFRTNLKCVFIVFINVLSKILRHFLTGIRCFFAVQFTPRPFLLLLEFEPVF